MKNKVQETQSKAFETISWTFEQIFAGFDSKPLLSPLAAGMALASLTNILAIDLVISNALSETEVQEILGLFLIR